MIHNPNVNEDLKANGIQFLQDTNGKQLIPFESITKEDIVHDNTRIGCRGIVCKDDLYLVVRLKEWDIYTFPGGGLEENETLEECCQREVLEETGIIILQIAP